MSGQVLEWTAFNKTNFKRMVGAASLSILAIRRDSIGYYGQVTQTNDEYVEIANGDMLQNLYFSGVPTVFAIIDEPLAPSYKLQTQKALPL